MFGPSSLTAISGLSSEVLRAELRKAGLYQLDGRSRPDLIDAVYCLRNNQPMPDWLKGSTPQPSIALSKWFNDCGTIWLTLVADKTTGNGWYHRLLHRGYRIDTQAAHIIGQPEFNLGINRSYRLAILLGPRLNPGNWTTAAIRQAAALRGLVPPQPVAACLLREALSDEDIESMGVSNLIVFHDAVRDSSGHPLLLGTDKSNYGYGLRGYFQAARDKWPAKLGFVFITR